MFPLLQAIFLDEHTGHRAWEEVGMLRHCIHPRIVPLYGVAIQVLKLPAAAVESWHVQCTHSGMWHAKNTKNNVQGPYLLLVMELMEGGSLSAALQDAKGLHLLKWQLRCAEVMRACLLLRLAPRL